MALTHSEASLVSNPMAADVRRSKFTIPHKHLTTGDPYKLYPCYLDMSIMPGDTVKMRVATLVRMLTPIAPVLDNCYMDLMFFAVPYRLVWDSFKEFMGEDSNTYWTQPVEKFIPQITPPSTGWNVDSVADHFEIPSGVSGGSISALPFRAYARIWNEWFRSESIVQPVSISLGDAGVTGTNGTWTTYIADGSLGGEPLRVARYHDIFTSALQQPQAGLSVELPINGFAPVFPTSKTEFTIKSQNWYTDIGAQTMTFGTKVPNPSVTSLTNADYYPDLSVSGAHNVVTNGPDAGYNTTAGTQSYVSGINPNNLVADLNNINGSGITITALRQAFALQRLLETVNRGSRYIEIIKNCFNITSPDARMQRTELLSAVRLPINMAEINQTSSTDSTSPLGTPGANSKTYGEYDDLFTYSATEHCMIIGLWCIRNNSTLTARGINPFWRKKDRFSFYWPQLEGLSDMPIPNSSLFWQDDSITDSDGNVINDLPFGYSEPWAEYRSNPDAVTGMFRPYVNQTLGTAWTYVSNFTQLPTLSRDFLYPDGSEITSTLAINNQPAFRADFYFDPVYVRPMPVYSVPGLTRL